MAILAASAEKQEAAFKFVALGYGPGADGVVVAEHRLYAGPQVGRRAASMKDFFAENPNFKIAVDQLAKTKPQDAARVFIPNGDQIIGKGLERDHDQSGQRSSRCSTTSTRR